LNTNVPRKTTGVDAPALPLSLAHTIRRAACDDGDPQMTTFNKVFTTERLVQIIVVLMATILMKLLS
jgi:hypothetical protein